MAPRSTKYQREPKEWFHCPIRGCHQKFRSQAGRTKHTRIKHREEPQTRTPTSLSDSFKLKTPPPASILSSGTGSLPIDSDESDHQHSDIMSEGPRTPYQIASNKTNMSPSRSPTVNGPLSPPLFHLSSPSSQPGPDVEIHCDHTEQVPMLSESTNYHPLINGMT
jgi:hypothetical protein